MVGDVLAHDHIHAAGANREVRGVAAQGHAWAVLAPEAGELDRIDVHAHVRRAGRPQRGRQAGASPNVQDGRSRRRFAQVRRQATVEVGADANHELNGVVNGGIRDHTVKDVGQHRSLFTRPISLNFCVRFVL